MLGFTIRSASAFTASEPSKPTVFTYPSELQKCDMEVNDIGTTLITVKGKKMGENPKSCKVFQVSENCLEFRFLFIQSKTQNIAERKTSCNFGGMLYDEILT